MKKIDKVLLMGAISIMATGLSAQSTKPHFKHSKLHNVKLISSKKFIVKGNETKKVTSGGTNASMQYPNTEAVYQTSYSLTNGWTVEYLNADWTIADSGTVANPNYDLNHSATVAFDTIIDYNTGNTPYSAMAGSVTIDTLIAPVIYKNISGINDTAVFIVTNVTASGYPGTTVLGTYTVLLNQGMNLPGNNLDTIYQIGVLPNLTIPSGTKFAVTLQFNGPKVDTFGYCYAYPNMTCSSSGYDYAYTFTYIGPAFGPTPACNSFVTGWEYYEYPNYAPMTWPNDSGNQVGNFAGTNAFDNDEWSLCGADTEYFYWQDNAIYASISFNAVTGIATVSNNGLSVSQNYPNPFNKATEIDYSVTKASDITFTVYDVTGRNIVNNTYTEVAPGKHEISLQSMQFTPGIYFYTFNINGVTETKKMIITE